MFKENLRGNNVAQFFPASELQFSKPSFVLSKKIGDATINFTAVRGLYNDHFYFYGSDISEIVNTQNVNQQLVASLKERLKKLECLMNISQEIQANVSARSVIPTILKMLPASYQFPDITCMRLEYKGDVYKTENYKETQWGQKVNIYEGKNIVGQITVRYLENPGDYYEGPFLQEERHLISAVAFLFSSFSRRLLVENENKMLRKAVEQNPVSILICDSEGKIEFVNAEYQKSSGYSESELIGKNPSILNSNTHPPEFFKKMWDTLKSGSIWTGDILNKNKSGDLYWEHGSISPIYDERATLTHFVEVKENITERKKIEEQLFQAKINAEKANKSKSEFLANISHEIRTPLNSIIGFADLLQGELQNSVHLDRVQSIKISSHNLLSLINDILDLAKIEAGKLELQYKSVNVKKLLAELQSVFSLRVQEKRLIFTCIVPDSLPESILLDEHRLRQILINLISNAIKFTEKGKVVIEVLFSVAEDNTLALSFSVSDTGPGIAPHQIEEIFQNFSQGDSTKQKHVEGTGLGLSISRRLTELMHGKLSVESQLGTGSVFVVTFDSLKFENNQENEVILSQQYKEEVRFRNQVVFVVDDQEAERNFIALGLESAGLSVKVFESGQTALNYLDAFKPDAVITDVVMPQMNGYELGQKINARNKSIPIVAMSASVMSESDKMREFPYFKYMLIKPFTLGELYVCLRNFLEFDRVMTVTDQAKENSNFEAFGSAVYNTFYDSWRKFEVNQPLDEVKEFASSLKQYASKNNMSGLDNYARSLLDALETYNIERLISVLKLFPSLCKQPQNAQTISK